MLECAERRLARPLQELAEGRIVRRVDAQRERVDEVADHRLELAAVATGERRSHHDVVLPRVPVEQRRERCQESDEQGCLALSAESLESVP